MIEECDQKEKFAITELKRRMKEISENELKEDDSLFYNFLKARDFDVNKAEKMLKEHLDWREKYDVKNISKCKYPEVLEKYFAFNKLGYDKEGCVVRYVPCGNIDWIGLFESSKFEDLTKCFIHYFEEDVPDLKNCSLKEGKMGDKRVFIYNMENFSFEQATNKKVILNSIFLVNMYLNNYPETLKVIYITNASLYFHLLFSALKKFLPSSIINKFKIYYDDSWKEDLLKTIDAEILPAFLGGKRTDPDGNPLCLTFINHGEPVPREYYIHRSKRSLSDLPDVQQLTLPNASFREIFLEVKEPDCYLEWEFETENRDIGFGLFHEDDEENKTEIIPIQRINTDEYAETGLFQCENVGKYIVVFDNTYSILRKKDVFYRIKIVKQSEEEIQGIN